MLWPWQTYLIAGMFLDKLMRWKMLRDWYCSMLVKMAAWLKSRNTAFYSTSNRFTFKNMFPSSCSLIDIIYLSNIDLLITSLSALLFGFLYLLILKVVVGLPTFFHRSRTFCCKIDELRYNISDWLSCFSFLYSFWFLAELKNEIRFELRLFVEFSFSVELRYFAELLF